MTIIKLDHITKIEGHAKLIVRVRKKKIEKAELDVFEGARYFENIVKGRSYDEVAQITSRICGLCSSAHTIAALKAVEDALGIEVSEQTRLLRELMHYGGIIQDHVLHCFFLALPDYVGYESAIAMASKYKKEVTTALKLKRLGNDILRIVGGREVHPISAIVGGFSLLPDKKELDGLLKKLKQAKKDVIWFANSFAKLKYPKFERKTEHFCLEDGKSFCIMDGHVSCVSGTCIPTKDYNLHFKEYFNPESTAKFVQIAGKSYAVGSLARINKNLKFLSKDAKKIIAESKIKFPNYCPFLNNFAQAVETVHLFDRCIEILENLDLKEESLPEVKPRAGRGIGVLEAPRGLLFHDYTLDEKGDVVKANIITPTAQNLRNIEDDIKAFLPGLLRYQRPKIVLELEKLIRAYDPCISCSTHFLEVEWE